MTNDELTAALALTETSDEGWWPAEEYDHRYVDWSSKTSDGLRMEIGDDAEATQIEMVWDEIEQLHRALTLRIIRHRQTATD